MAAYTVTAHLDGVAPRVARRSGTAGADVRRPGAPGGPAESVDLVGRPIDIVLAERWTSFRERWSQTTFFLFDPDSWR